MGSRGRRSVAVTESTIGATTAPPTVPTASVTFSPRNPRDPDTDYDPDADEDLAEMIETVREVGLVQPIGVVRYEVYLAQHPEHEKKIGAHDWVCMTGNRRLAAAKKAGLDKVPILSLDHLARTGHLDEAVLIENIHRKALPPIREAQALKALVDRHGTQAEAAKRVGKTQVFVSQRLALLKLVPELREAVERGELPVKVARDVGRLPAAEQVIEWQRRQNQAAPAAVAGRGPQAVLEERPPADGTGARLSTGATSAPRRSTSTATPDSTGGASAAGERGQAAGAGPVVIRLGSPDEIAAQLRRHLHPNALRQLAAMITDDC